MAGWNKAARAEGLASAGPLFFGRSACPLGVAAKQNLGLTGIPLTGVEIVLLIKKRVNPMSVRYYPNYQKILEAIIYVAQKAAGNDFHHILKVLFYADKLHLQRFARPVLGDSYIKMSAGPVGSFAYDLLKMNDFLPGEILQDVSESISVNIEKKAPRVSTKRDPDLTYFSGSDLKCLDEAISLCIGKSFSDLCDLTHQEKSWSEANINSEMDYENFIDDETPNREELIAHIKATSHTLVL
ncbi:MAG: SocA family protein [Desulfovibrionaceae bacterium]|nr:SocA family protein [Desulfovibrionaceae bacterium]MBF0514147.1 SocA family protein [Desulfovibrionaceae bacterium]